MKSKNLNTVILMVSCLVISYENAIIAGNLMGSDINWQCIGKDSFLVTVTIIKDCDGINLANNSLYARCISSGSIITSNVATATSQSDITPVNGSCTKCDIPTCTLNLGYKKYTFEHLIDLSNAGTCCEVELFWSDCCRNNIMTTSPDQKISIKARLNRCITPCDNSPKFTSPLVIIACKDQNLIYNPGAIDDDGDVLVYSLTSPLTDSLNSKLIYNTSYSFDEPLQFEEAFGFNLDSDTGNLYFKPVQEQNAVYAIKVEEYRDGQKIGEIVRDMQIIVMDCDTNYLPELYSKDGKNYKEIFAGDTDTFVIRTEDQNPSNRLNISWNSSIKGASWDDFNGLVKWSSGSVIWTPDFTNVSPNPYYFTATVKDDASPLYHSQSRAYQITVKPMPIIAGNVKAGGNKVINGSAKLIKKEDYSIIKEVSLNTEGYYQFSNVAIDSYLIKVVQDKNSPYFERYFPVYYGNKIFWEDASPVFLFGDNYDINLVKGKNLNGPGAINGKVLNDSEPVSGIQIMLFTNNEPVKYKFTDQKGEFSFDDLSFNNYQVYIELLGTPTFPTPDILIDLDNTVLEKLIFDITLSNGINVNFNELISIGTLRPNPATNTTILPISVKNDFDFDIRIYDILGNLHYDVKKHISQSKNNIQLDLSNYKPGIYMVILGHETQKQIVFKLVKTH